MQHQTLHPGHPLLPRRDLQHQGGRERVSAYATRSHDYYCTEDHVGRGRGSREPGPEVRATHDRDQSVSLFPGDDALSQIYTGTDIIYRYTLGDSGMAVF